MTDEFLLPSSFPSTAATEAVAAPGAFVPGHPPCDPSHQPSSPTPSTLKPLAQHDTGLPTSSPDFDTLSCVNLEDLWRDDDDLLRAFGLDATTPDTLRPPALLDALQPWHNLATTFPGGLSGLTDPLINMPYTQPLDTMQPQSFEPSSMGEAAPTAGTHASPPPALSVDLTDVAEFEEYLNIPSTATSAHMPVSSEFGSASSPATSATSPGSSTSRPRSSSPHSRRKGGKKRSTIADAAELGAAREQEMAIRSPALFRNLVLVITGRYYADLARLMECTRAEVVHEAMTTSADSGGKVGEDISERWKEAVESVGKVASSLIADGPPISPPPLTCESNDSKSSPLPATPGSAYSGEGPVEDLAHQQSQQTQSSDPPNYLGVWSEVEIQRLRDLAAQSQLITGKRIDWDFVVRGFKGRNRRQILLKATLLGLKKPSTRTARRVLQRSYRQRLERMVSEMGKGEAMSPEPMSPHLNKDEAVTPE